MTAPLMKRIGNWVGTWRGPVEYSCTGNALIELVVTPVFDGEAIETVTTTIDPATGKTILYAYALYSLGRDGRVQQLMFSPPSGFCRPVGVEDDPDVNSFEGALSGNRNLHMSMHLEMGELVIVTRVREGYMAGSVPEESISRLKRVGEEAPVE